VTSPLAVFGAVMAVKLTHLEKKYVMHGVSKTEK